MPRLIVLYPQPTDVTEFERVFRDEHVPLVRAQLVGVTRLEASRVIPSPREEGIFHWMGPGRVQDARVMTWAWIRPLIAPSPKRSAKAAATAAVASANAPGRRASISLRRGVPWQ